MYMKVFLDDTRSAPQGWELCTTTEQAIALLERGVVGEISLDHDLGEGDATGYDVACWIENKVYTDNNYKCPVIRIHSMNPVGRNRIQQVIDQIENIYKKRSAK